MKLVGMLDSPYVRRVAISLQFLGLPFEHQALSVFDNYDEYKAINPAVKAPTLICDDGDIILDSNLIIEYAETLTPGRSLLPADAVDRQHAMKTIGLALAACEKSIQLVYEDNLRPAEKRHQPWIDRVTEQLLAALALIEEELKARPITHQRSQINQVGITTAVMWTFTQKLTPEVVPVTRFPLLNELSRAAEQLPEFATAPHGNGIFPVTPG